MNNVIEAKANEDFSLGLKFEDGSVKRFDVTPYLNLGVFRELKDADYFKQVTIASAPCGCPTNKTSARTPCT